MAKKKAEGNGGEAAAPKKRGRKEAAAERAAGRQREEELRWKVYRSIPQKHWREMSGRQTKQLHEQAERYGIPFGGAVIDLGAVVARLHEFLAENARKLAGADDEDDPDLAGVASKALERYRRAKAAREEIALKRDLGEWVRRDVIHAKLGRMAQVLRQLGEGLQRIYGDDARRLVEEALDRWLREMDADGPVA